jgi:hypothetical protein
MSATKKAPRRVRRLSGALVTFGVSVAILSDSADACRLYSRWHYPTPQRCDDGHHDNAVMRARAAEAKIWFVEITKLPPLTDDEQRASAIERLKLDLSAH